jgi:serine/threonine-protein kinase RsbT
LTDQALIATAISELARNIVLYARSGEVRVDTLTNGGRRGLIVVARDDGPGIPDIERALEPGFSTSGGLGLGLPGVRRLMDELKVESKRGRGTTVTARKWLR